MNPLRELRKKFLEWLFIPEKDLSVIDFVASIFVSSAVQGTPVWGYLIGPSGGLKSELLRAWDVPIAFHLDRLTAASTVSGFRGGGRDPSILPLIDGKVMVIKDFSAIINLPREARESIFATWRSAYDGDYSEAFGNIGKVSYQSLFSLLVGTTSVVDILRKLHQVLGERFVSFRIASTQRMASAKRAVGNVSKLKMMRKDLGKGTRKFLRQVEDLGITDVSLNQELEERVIELGDLTARFRSQVLRSGPTQKDIHYIPEAEIGTRLAQQLKVLIQARAIASGREKANWEDFSLAIRVARDSLPGKGFLVLRVLHLWYRKVGPRGYLSDRHMEDILGFSTLSLRTICEDLYLLDILARKKKRFGYRYRLLDDVADLIDKLSLWDLADSYPSWVHFPKKRKKRRG